MARILSKELRINFRWRVQLEYKPEDMWVGAFWVKHGSCVDLWVCVVPCFPLHFWKLV